jgi:hypothetical protein
MLYIQRWMIRFNEWLEEDGNNLKQHSEVEFWEICPRKIEDTKLNNTITDQKDVGYASTSS